MQAQIIKNMAHLCIGLACRGGVFAHLTASPVEKETILPGIEMLGQKIMKVGYHIIGQDTAGMDEKTQFLKTLYEIQYAQHVSICTDQASLTHEITTATTFVQSSSYTDIHLRSFDIYRDIGDLQKRLMTECR